MRRIATATFVILCLVGAARAAPLGPADRDYDQVHLALRVEPEIPAGTISAEARLTFEPLVGGFQTLRLHAVDLTVLSVTDSANRSLAFRAAEGVLAIDLADPLARGSRETVAITYRARPRRGLYFHAPTEDRPYVPLSMYSQGEGTDNRHWIPCYDEPDDRLTLCLTAVIPDGLVSVGNGVLESAKDLPGPKREETWRMDDRLPTYLVSLAVGPYETWREERDGVVFEINSFPGRLAETREAFGRAADMAAFFGEWLGYPYPYPRYAQTTVWEFLYGGMENTTATTMSLRLPHGPETRPNFSADPIVAHELAHQWFGDLLTCRTWHHIWLNEGFATYFADLWCEHDLGEDEFRVRRWRQTRGYLAGTPAPEKLELKPDARGDRPLELFGGKQYNRGAAILHMLRLEVGDDAFRRGLARYVRDHADSAVVTEDLCRSVEAEAGRDLSWFFDQWVYGAGYPVLDVGVVEEDEGVRLSVRQTQVEGGGQGVFRLTLPVRLETTAGPIRARLPIRDREQEFLLPTEGDLLHVRADDGAWLLGRVEVHQGPDAFAHQARTDADPVGRIEALAPLLRSGEAGVGVVAEVLRADEFWAVREAAAKALAGRDDNAAALDALLAAAKDEDSRVREAALEALGGFDRAGAGAAVLAAVRGETHPYVRAAAARSLGRLHVVGAFEALSALLEVASHREVVRQGALKGLAALGSRKAIPGAMKLLDHRFGLGAQSSMRRAALNLLLTIAPDDRETRTVVTGLLDDPYFRMREWAAAACGRYDYRDARKRLERMAEKDPSPGARHAARRALDEWKD